MKTGLINIGNTHTEICNSDFNGYFKVKSDKLVESINSRSAEYSKLVIASVVPEISARIKESLSGKSVYFLNAENVEGIDLSEIDKSTIGADRLANILGAKSNFGSDFLVIDCGTCVTAELVCDNVFKGGLIMPGRALQRKAVNLYTGQLPESPLSDTVKVTGTNTKDAIAVGIDSISLIGLQNWIQSIITENEKVKICFTGGDARFYLQNAPFEFIELPNMTLQGLKVFADSLNS